VYAYVSPWIPAGNVRPVTDSGWDIVLAIAELRKSLPCPLRAFSSKTASGSLCGTGLQAPDYALLVDSSDFA
jgi:hypothetical protein